MSLPIVLVHGAFHSSSCWKKVVDILEREKIDVICIDLPGHGENKDELSDTYGDAQRVRETLESLDDPPVLVGHSYGGAAITEAVNKDGLISHIVYVSAVLHDIGECVADTPYFGDDWPYYQTVVDNGDGTFSINKEKAIDVFYHDCEEVDISWAISDLCNQRLTVDQKFHHAPWKTVESTYLMCEQDKVLPIDIQKHWAKKCVHQESFDSGHMLMISNPDKLAALLMKLAG